MSARVHSAAGSPQQSASQAHLPHNWCFSGSSSKYPGSPGPYNQRRPPLDSEVPPVICIDVMATQVPNFAARKSSQCSGSEGNLQKLPLQCCLCLAK